MASMRNRFSEIHTYGCHAHMANLLSKDILQQKELKAITSKIIAVLKFLRNSHSCTSELQSKNLGRPPIPCETRWNSYVVSLEYFLKNWAQIADVINSTTKSSDAVYKYMEDISLKRAVEDILEFLKNIGVMLDTLQSDQCTLSATFTLWKNVLSSAPIQYADCVSKRSEMPLTGITFAANLLDHRFHGNDMNPVETASAVDYIKNFGGTELMEDLVKYMGKVQPYNDSLFGDDYKNVSPDAWWKGGIKFGFSAKLVQIACSIVTAVASSAGLERYFSTLGLTYGTLRSSLGVEKAGKMAFLFKQLNKD